MTRTQWLGTVQSAAPSVASTAQLDNFWDRYWWVFVKGYHVLEYFVLVILLLRAFPTVARQWLWFATVLYAATDEIHQLSVPARGGNATDVLIDATGATLGVIAYALAKRSLSPPSSPPPPNCRPEAAQPSALPS